MTMLSYHNDPVIKAKYIARFEAHRSADQVVQGQGFDSKTGRGCFVGCTLDAYEHSHFPVELGWPIWLAHLADTIFEGLPKSEAPAFGTDLLACVPVGIDLEIVRVPFLVSVQRRNLDRLSGNFEPYAEQCRTAIQGVINFLLADAPSAESAAESAESAARSARSAESAARSAESAESQIQRDVLLSILRSLRIPKK